MNITDFPLIVASLEKTKRFEDALAAINEGVAKGEIPNVTFKDVVMHNVRRVLETAWKNHISQEFTWNGKWDTLSQEEKELDEKLGCYPEVHTIEGKIKLLNKTKLDTPYVRATRALLAEMLPLALVIKDLKGKTVKRQPKADVDPYEPYRAPRASKTAIIATKAALMDVTEKAYERLLNAFRNHNTFLAEKYRKLQQIVKKQQNEKLIDTWDYRTGKFTTSKENEELKTLKENHGFLLTLLVPNLDTTDEEVALNVEQESKKAADHIRECFVYKNLVKLDSIYEAKGNFKSIQQLSYDVSLTGLEGAFRVSFADGSSFDIQNIVVYMVSPRGKPFERFPLTFHNVVLPDGSKMKRPSEERVNTVFVAGKE